MKVFVTGATGVLGRETLALLQQNGHEVRALARSGQNLLRIRELGAEPVRGTLLDAASWRAALRGCDAILHLATCIPSKANIGRLSAWAENDRIRTVGTRLLVDMAIEAGVGTLIYPSVVFLYPDSGDAWIDEDFPTQPVAHVRSTLDAEGEIARFQAHGGRGITLRMGRFYGPDSWDVRDTITAAGYGLSIVPGSPNAYIPMIWVRDAARAVVAALERAPGGVWNVTNNEPLPLREHSAILAAAAGRRRLVGLPPVLLRLMLGTSLYDALTRSQRVSNRRFREATGWAPEVASARDGWPLVRELQLEHSAARKRSQPQPMVGS